MNRQLTIIHRRMFLPRLNTFCRKIQRTQCVWSSHIYMQSTDQPCKVANPARCLRSRENTYFPVPVCASEFSFARQVRPSRPASACAFSTLRVNLALIHGTPPDFRGGGVHLFYPPYAIGSVPSLLGHAIAYQWWCSLPSVRRHRASSPQGTSNNGCCFCRYITMDQLLCASISPHPLLV